MNTLEGSPLLEHYNLLLATNRERHAWAVLQDVFECFGKEGLKEHAWYTLVMALGNDSAEMKGKDRSSMIHFYECCAALFSAAYLLQKNYEPANEDEGPEIIVGRAKGWQFEL